MGKFVQFLKAFVYSLGERVNSLIFNFMAGNGMILGSVKIPNGSTLYIGSTYGASKVMSVVTNAAEAVATLEASHGIIVNDIMVVTSGWSRLNARVLRAKTVSTNDVTLEGFVTTDTTLFPAGSGTGSIVEVTAFTEIQQVLEVSTSGGDQQFATFSFLSEFDEHQLPTVRSPLALSMSIADDTSLAHYAVLKAASDARTNKVLKLVLPGGAGTLYYNGVVTLQETPTLTKNQVMALSVTFSLQSAVTRY